MVLIDDPFGERSHSGSFQQLQIYNLYTRRLTIQQPPISPILISSQIKTNISTQITVLAQDKYECIIYTIKCFNPKRHFLKQTKECINYNYYFIGNQSIAFSINALFVQYQIIQYLLFLGMITKMHEDKPLPNFKYTFQLPHFCLNLILKVSETTKTIEMEFTNIQKELYYNLTINQQLIDWDNNLAVYFKIPEILFQEMIANPKGISITQEGEVTFEIMIGRRKQHCKFKATKKQLSKEQHIFARINQLSKQNDQRYEQIRQENRLLKDQITKLVNQQNDKITKILNRLEIMQKNMIQGDAQRIKKNEQNIQIKRQFQLQRNLRLKSQEQMMNMRKQMQDLFLKLQKLNKQLIQQKQTRQLKLNQHHIYNQKNYKKYRKQYHH